MHLFGVPRVASRMARAALHLESAEPGDFYLSGRDKLGREDRQNRVDEAFGFAARKRGSTKGFLSYNDPFGKIGPIDCCH